MSARRDAGSMYVLEATLVLIIMMTAIVSVVLFKPADSSLDASEDVLMRRVKDQILVWDDLPAHKGATTDCDARTIMEQLVYDGLEGDHELWTKRTEWTRPHLEADMVLDNGPYLYPLHGSGDVLGSAYALDWWPRQDYVFPVTSLNRATGGEALVVDVPGVHWAGVPRLAGEAVRTAITFTGATGDESTTHVWSPTALIPSTASPSEGRDGAENAYWALPTGHPLLAGDAFQTFGAGAHGQPARFTLRLDGAPAASGGARLFPVGTTIAVVIPVGWDQARWLDPPSGWETEVDESAAGTRLTATLREGAPSDAVLVVSAVPPQDPTQPFDVIRAKLGGGSFGESNLIVTYPFSAERSLPRVVAPTTPYPVRAGSWAMFGASFFNGGEEVKVTQVDIELPGGYDLTFNGGAGAPLFAGIHDARSELFYPPEPDEELPRAEWRWQRVGPTHLRWSDPDGIVVPALKAAYWAVPVEITSDVSVRTSIHSLSAPAPNATLVFENGFRIAGDTWGKSPGTIRVRVPPATRALDHPDGGTTDGYPWRLTPLGELHVVNATHRSPMAGLVNETSYASGPLGADAVSLESAITNASLVVTKRAARVGERLAVEGDLSSLLKLVDQPGVEAELFLDLYTPPSRGCAPTRTWRLDPAILPTSPVLSLVVDESSLPGVFAGTQDGYVQRLDVTGRPTWTTLSTGNPVILERVETPTDDGPLLVGTLTGRLVSLHAGTGASLWSRTILHTGGASIAPEATLVAHDAANQRILAGNNAGHLLAWDEAGSLLAEVALAGSILDAKPLPNGDVLALSPTKLHRLDHTLTTEHAHFPTDAVGFARGAQHVLVADRDTWVPLDPQTLAPAGAYRALDSSATSAARGDATGDGVEDLVVARADLTLLVIDGATLGTRTITLTPNIAGTGLQSWDLDDVDTGAGTLGAPEDCEPPATYLAPRVCTAELSPSVLLLRAHDGRVSVAYTSGHEYQLEHYAGDTGEWRWGERVATRPTSLAQGAWPTGRVSVWGDEQGLIAVQADDGRNTVASRAGDRVGKFTFHLHVPEGGFYGAHLLVARLVWGTQEHEARLVEWFEVVGANGEPVTRPSYNVVLAVDSREYPHRRG